jgi:mono/diheme cytochrome c family protein
MRERIAIGITLLTLTLLVVLATVFATSQNRPGPTAQGAATLMPASQPAVMEGGDAGPASQIAQQAADSVRGRAVYEKATCQRCHSIEGVGNRRYPLDGVGARRTRAQLRDWTIGAGAVVDSLSPSAARAKRQYAELPKAEMDALLHFMARLITEP